MPALTRETFQHHTGASDLDEARDEGVRARPGGGADCSTSRCSSITGKLDRLIPWEQTKQIADAAPNAEFVLYDEGNHVCNNIPYKYRPLVADWLREQLG